MNMRAVRTGFPPGFPQLVETDALQVADWENAPSEEK